MIEGEDVDPVVELFNKASDGYAADVGGGGGGVRDSHGVDWVGRIIGNADFGSEVGFLG